MLLKQGEGRNSEEKERSTTYFSTEIPTWLPLKPHPKKKTKLCMIYPSASGVIYKDNITRHHLFCRAAVVLHFGQTSFWHIKRSYTQVIFNLDQFPNSRNHTATQHSYTSNTEGVGWWQAALSSSVKFEHQSCTLKNKHQEMTDLAVLILLLVRLVSGEIVTGLVWIQKKQPKTKTHQTQVRIIKLKSAIQHRSPTTFTRSTTEGSAQEQWLLKQMLRE